MGETRVDLLHLLEDLRDAYPGATEETILTEIVANSLDSGATTIAITTDPTRSTVTILDNGTGMRRRELARYHDVAASTKARGEGIGFAGVGIKLGLLVCEEVLTETRLRKHHVATTWRLASRHRAPWKWVVPPGLVAERGTAVRLSLRNALSPLLDPGLTETVLRRHFQPLLDLSFGEILAAHYPRGVRFVLNGRPLDKQGWNASEVAPIAVRLPRKRKAAAAGYVVRDLLPLSEERRGIAISTFGKIIKHGWDWLGVAPVFPERVGGLIEVPALAECLTLNKADFIRGGTRGAVYLAYRKAIQEAVSRQLSVWGDSRDTEERARRRAARPVERDLEAVVTDLAETFPLLSALVERRAGGQRRLPLGRPQLAPDGAGLAGPLSARPGSLPQANQRRAQTLEEPPGPPETSEPVTRVEPASQPAPGIGTYIPAASGPRRSVHYGLSVQFEQRPEDGELARLVESTVWVNESHPAHRRAVASRSEGYHIALAAAMALAPLAVEPAKEHAFLTAFLASWGAATDRRKGTRGR